MTLSFRARLARWYGAALTTLLLLTAGALLKMVSVNAQRRLDAVLRIIVRQELERPDATSSNLALPMPSDTEPPAHAHAGNAFKSVSVPEAGSLRIVYPAGGAPQDGRPAVVAGLPASLAARRARAFELVIIGAFGAIIKMTGGIGSILAKRTLQTIRSITAQAETINADDVSARLRGVEGEVSRRVTVLNGLLARLDPMVQAQRRVTSRAADELRTPLTILKGETQVILRSRRTVEEYQPTLHSSPEEIDKLVGIIDDLRLLAIHESGKAEITSHSVTRPEGRITVTPSKVPDEVEWVVTDTEAGIKTEYLPNIFRGLDLQSEQDRGTSVQVRFKAA